MTPLAAGTKLGAYEILGNLGGDAGCSGVYRATDTRDNRAVTIKVLETEWAEKPEFRERLERETRAIASLNHKHIGVIQEIAEDQGLHFLVMEPLEGVTLAERLGRGPMTLEEALTVAIAIADALDKAHRQGVSHHGLNPSNVMLTESGAKLLDFGLSGVREPVLESSGRLSGSAALASGLYYLAPEQIEGGDADSRADIFALGSILHEMVAGRKAFAGKTEALVLSAITEIDPQPLSKAVPATPAALEHIVRVCLAKSPKDRWQTPRDVLAELEWIAGGGAETVVATLVPAASKKRQRLLMALLAAVVLLTAAAAWPAALYLRGTEETGEARFNATVPLSAQPNPLGNSGQIAQSDFAISPDGKNLAYVTRNANTEPWVLYIRPLGSVTPLRLPGTEGATQPFWSADGRSVGFIANGKLKKVEATGGPPQEISDAAGFSGGAWNKDGVILFGSPRGLMRVSAQGGKPEPATELEASESGHLWPQFLPDGENFLYLAWASQTTNRAVYRGKLGSKERTRIMAGESKTMYADPGHLLFRRESAVYAQAFDIGKLALTGDEPVRVADEVVANYPASGQGSFAVSPNGVLVYFFVKGELAPVLPLLIAGPAGGGGNFGFTEEWDRQLAWASRTAAPDENLGPFGKFRGVEISPDGKRIAVHRHDDSGGDIFVLEPKPREALTRITRDPSRDNSSPVWSPDGKRIVYTSFQKEKWGLYQTLSDGSGTEELLFESEALKAPMSWSPDGKSLVFWVQDPKTNGDLWVLAMDGERKATPLLNTPANETHAQISPDGKWIAYTSNSTGGRREIYVQPFPSGSGLWQISDKGGDWPRWNRSGKKELFYHALGDATNPDGGSGFSGFLFAVDTNVTGAAFEHGPPRQVLNTPVLNPPHPGGDFHVYDISPDGQRFLLYQVSVGNVATLINLINQLTGPDPPAGMVVALNWASPRKK